MLACCGLFAFTAGPLRLAPQGHAQRDGCAPGSSVCGCSRPWALQLLGSSSSVVSLLRPDEVLPGFSPLKVDGPLAALSLASLCCCSQPRVGAGGLLCTESTVPEVPAAGASHGHAWALGTLLCQRPLPAGLSPAPWDHTEVLAALGAVLATPARSRGFPGGTAGWCFILDPGSSCISSVCVCESSPKGNGVCW